MVVGPAPARSLHQLITTVQIGINSPLLLSSPLDNQPPRTLGPERHNNHMLQTMCGGGGDGGGDGDDDDGDGGGCF